MIWLQRMAIVEGLTLIGLVCIAVPLKYWADMPQFVSLLGPIHGGAFIIFIVFVMRALGEELIGIWGALRLFIGAMIPFGGFVNERWLRRVAAQAEQ